jgi:hypothetical protein
MLIVVVTILTLAGIAFLYLAAKTEPNSFLDRFSIKLQSMVTIFLATLVYLSYNIQNEAITVRQQETTLKIIERSWLGVNSIINTEYSKCPNFINSLYFDWQKKEMNWKTHSSQIEDQWTSILYLSVQIFQAFEDVLTVSNLDQTGFYVWIANFLQWCSSNELRKSWNVLKPNFATSTRKFGDFIFEYLSSNPHPKNITELTELSKQLADSPEIKDLLKI